VRREHPDQETFPPTPKGVDRFYSLGELKSKGGNTRNVKYKRFKIIYPLEIPRL
jgi:hypothetical protein